MVRYAVVHGNRLPDAEVFPCSDALDRREAGCDCFLLKPSIEESGQGPPWLLTVPGVPRAAWSFGGDMPDRIEQVLYLGGDMETKTIQEATCILVKKVILAVRSLVKPGIVRRFRREGAGQTQEPYGVARAVRNNIDAASA